jgi:DNA repair protein RadD
MAKFQLRDYQKEAVSATIKHFQKTNESAVIVLPTGSGKSLVIAELARLAKRKILVLTHVKELVEQNHQKFESYGLTAGIYSAGLKKKENQHPVTFASIQSAARNLEDFSHAYSLIIIDECHRVNIEKIESTNIEQDSDIQKNDSSLNQYQQIIQQLKTINPDIKLLGLTATPYRLGMGWIYKKHYRGIMRSEDPRPFEHCIYELPLRYLIKKQFLTPPTLIDATIEHYDFSSLKSTANGEYNSTEVNDLLSKHHRVTRGITEHIVQLASHRQGVMIFAATVDHALEIAHYLPTEQSAVIIGSTENKERDYLIESFKQKRIKYLVNVSVLTTGFDAPHVDLIAILRPTQSVSLYQQIIGRGLRLSPGKEDCLVIDYTGNNFDLYQPEVGEKKPNSAAKPVQVMCPSCDFANIFWGIVDDDGYLVEHYGRRCQGLLSNENNPTEIQQGNEHGGDRQCNYRFVFKECRHCGEENDIAARKCIHCAEVLVDPDDMLKKALQLTDAKVLRCSGLSLEKKKDQLMITYHDEEGSELSEHFNFSYRKDKELFNQLFAKRLAINLETDKALFLETIEQVLAIETYLPYPDFVIARKNKYHWKIKDRIFDYQGHHRKANQLK